MATMLINKEEEMLAFGRKLAKFCQLGSVLFLYGELGAGKTTLVRGFLRALGYLGSVKSPTYTLVEPYVLSDKQIFHFDLYRLADAEELEYIGVRDYFTEKSIILIEWPEKGQDILPNADLSCYIRIFGNTRELMAQAGSEKGQWLLTQLFC